MQTHEYETVFTLMGQLAFAAHFGSATDDM